MFTVSKRVVTSSRHTRLRSTPIRFLPPNGSPARAQEPSGRISSPPEMSSIHAARCLLGSTTKSTRVAVVGRTYATQAKNRSLAQKTKS